MLGDGEEAVLRITALLREHRHRGRQAVLLELARSGVAYVPSLYDVSYLPDGRIAAVTPNQPGVPAQVSKHTVTDLDAWPYPKQPLVPLAETVHERMSVEIFRGCTRGCRFCQAGMITRPVRERSITGIGQMVERGLAATGYEEVGLLSLSSADHSEIGQIATGPRRSLRGQQGQPQPALTRVDAFNVTLAQEFSRSGRKSGLTFAPEGGSERLRRVINKMVSEEDLIRTVTTAYESGWRQVKLYFMCGLPTETDEDVLQIARMAKEVVQAGREATGQRDIRCTVSIGGFVPKPHTPFQWAGAGLGRGHRPPAQDACGTRRAGPLDRLPLPRRRARHHRGPARARRPPARRGVPRCVRRGGRFDGWREYFCYERWTEAAEARRRRHRLVHDPRARATPRCCRGTTWTPGLDKDWLWSDWQDALAAPRAGRLPVDALLRLRRLPDHGTEIEIGPTGRTLLPLTPVESRPCPLVGPRVRRRRRWSSGCGSGTPSATGCASPPTATSPAPSSAPSAARTCRSRFSAGFTPHPKISWLGAAPTGVASEAEYVEIGLAERLRRRARWRRRSTPACRLAWTSSTASRVSRGRSRTGSTRRSGTWKSGLRPRPRRRRWPRLWPLTR